MNGRALGSIVITTIQAPTPSLRAMAANARRDRLSCVVVGDRKTPDVDWPEPVRFISLTEQGTLAFSLASELPVNHYARKNIGYLFAMREGCPFIYDTDDDNAPVASWQPRLERVEALGCDTGGWVNAYAWYSQRHIWPRGLPLQAARRLSPPVLGAAQPTAAPIQQGLANGSPDVDAVWRLLMDEPIEFRDGPSVALGARTWCPFNSQSTWWFPEAYPLMYLPSFVSFRMTDIWRSFVAQRCLWAMDRRVVFHGAEVFQDRNEHNLLRDFEQEVPGYVGNDRFREVLEAVQLRAGAAAAGDNLRLCYEALVREQLIEERELPLVAAWLEDVRAARGHA
jgi:hypothetical protein